MNVRKLIDRLNEFRQSIHREKLINEFNRINPNPYLYKYWEHSTWGDNIEWRQTDEPFHKVVGWLSRLPKNGDKLLYQTENDDIAVGYFVNVEYCGNPKDMFFAEIIPVNIIKLKE